VCVFIVLIFLSIFCVEGEGDGDDDVVDADDDAYTLGFVFCVCLCVCVFFGAWVFAFLSVLCMFWVFWCGFGFVGGGLL